MNASSLIIQPAVPSQPGRPLTPQQEARRKAIAADQACDSLLRQITALKTQFEAGVANIQKLLDQNPRGLTRDEILARLTPAQRQAFTLVSGWAQTGLAAFAPPVAATSAAQDEQPAPPAESEG